jgi:hypothetical protein
MWACKVNGLNLFCFGEKKVSIQAVRWNENRRRWIGPIFVSHRHAMGSVYLLTFKWLRSRRRGHGRLNQTWCRPHTMSSSHRWLSPCRGCWLLHQLQWIPKKPVIENSFFIYSKSSFGYAAYAPITDTVPKKTHVTHMLFGSLLFSFFFQFTGHPSLHPPLPSFPSRIGHRDLTSPHPRDGRDSSWIGDFAMAIVSTTALSMNLSRADTVVQSLTVT